MTDYDYDTIVIGGGSGGSGYAKRAAGYGAKVCLIERGPQWDDAGVRTSAGPGGTCVNVGCVPKKIMFMAAAHREMMVGHVSTAKGFGYDVPESAGYFDWAGVKARRDAYVAKLNETYKGGWKKLGIEVLEGTASFEDPTHVNVQCTDGSTKTLTSNKVLIACGGLPDAPDIPGVEHAISSDGFFELKEQPKKVAVVGAGYIAVEMAGILHALGSETHLFFRGETVMRRGFDPFIVETLMDAMRRHGPTLHPFCQPDAITKGGDGLLTLTFKEGPEGNLSQLEGVDCLLLAIGRRPVTERLALHKVGIEVIGQGLIQVDEYENTKVPGVYAIGDCTTSGYELTPVAIAAGRRLADRLFGGEPKARIAYETIPTVVFSHPPIGMIGLTEPAAKKEFGEQNIRAMQSRFGSMFYAFNDEDGKVKTGLKLVLKLPEERVVGVHIIGPSSDEMLQGFAVAVRMGATRADFEASVAIHPTIAEEMVTFAGWGQKKVGDVVRPQLPPYLGS